MPFIGGTQRAKSQEPTSNISRHLVVRRMKTKLRDSEQSRIV